MCVFLTGAISLGYIANSVNKFITYKKFELNKYIGEYNLVECPITSQEEGLHSLVRDYQGDYKSLPKKSDDILIKHLNIDIGTEKTGTQLVPQKIGKQTVMIPQNYKYMEWQNVHNGIQWVHGIMSVDGKLKLNLILDKFTAFCNSKYSLHGEKCNTLFFRFLHKNAITSDFGDVANINEHVIKNNDNVTIFG